MASSMRAALYVALTADTGLTRLLATPQSVYHQVASLSAPFPYLIFGKQQGRPSWAFGDGRLDQELWLVKAVCEGPSAAPAEDVAVEVDRVLNDAALSIDGRALLYLRRDSDIDYLEQDGADSWHHAGAVYRLVTEPA